MVGCSALCYCHFCQYRLCLSKRFLLVSGMGLVASSAISTSLIKLGLVPLSSSHCEQIDAQFYLRKILPIGAFQALAMGFGTVAYLSLTVAFIQMLKAFTPVITLLVLYAFRIEKFNTRLTLAVGGISVGTLIAVASEVQLDVFGLVIHEISAVSEAIRLVLTQKMLTNMKFSPVEGLHYMAPSGALCMTLLVILFELRPMVQHNAWSVVVAHPMMFVSASVLGFALNILSFAIIQLTSSVMLKILSVVRTAALVVFCGVFLGEIVRSDTLKHTLRNLFPEQSCEGYWA
eukprot:m.211154 g.211154  ORF g.211154 m.211154 type:complete len:289 (-) comp19023_c0_seq31:501-1367(-)